MAARGERLLYEQDGGRLVHFLQLERGASCAWIASGGTRKAFAPRMQHWRRDAACSGQASLPWTGFSVEASLAAR